MTDPLTEAIRWYEGKGHTLKSAIDWHLRNGYIYAGKDAFILARPIDVRRLDIIDKPWIPQDENDANTWFVWFASGNDGLARFLELAPFKLDMVAWHRRGKIKIYGWKHLERKVRYGNRCTIAAAA